MNMLGRQTMAGEGIITVTGNVGGDAELHATNTGDNVATFSLANTPRVKKDGAWIDGETVWFRCAVWGKDAGTVATEVKKGARVIVTGRFNVSTYNDKLTFNINVDDYGIKPRNVSASVTNSDNISDDPWA
jgi:single-strand DNA-binding protein